MARVERRSSDGLGSRNSRRRSAAAAPRSPRSRRSRRRADRSTTSSGRSFEEILISADFRRADDGEDPRRAAHGLQSGVLAPAAIRAVDRFKLDLRRFLTLPNAGLSLRGRPAIVLVVGVNGSGKTTTIGKLGYALSKQRKRVMFVAADTFRAAAAEQLAVWADRAGAEFVRGSEGSDPSSVVYDGLAAAKARKVDVVFIDTAGRLQTKSNLMEELKKMRRIIERETGAPPDETLLVVDGTTGQNAISQAKLFNEATALTGRGRHEARLHLEGRRARRHDRHGRRADQVHRARRGRRRAASLRARGLSRRAVRSRRPMTVPCHGAGTAPAQP